MTFVVFAQEAHPLEGAFRVVAAARAHFDAEVTVDQRRESAASASARLTVATRDGALSAAVVGRAATEADLAVARGREAAAGGGGLALLAARCGFVWEVDAEGGEREGHRLAAILAAGLLGPVVTDDAIFGVRGARARAG